MVNNAVASNTQPFIITNPRPLICCLNPISASAGGGSFNLIVYGSSFVPNSVVQWNGSNRETTFLSSTELRASIQASDIARSGTANITVLNPVGVVSSPRPFSINDPIIPEGPTIDTINPTSVDAGGGDFTLTVNGTGFIPRSMVQLNGQDRATTFVNSTQLRAVILASDIQLDSPLPLLSGILKASSLSQTQSRLTRSRPTRASLPFSIPYQCSWGSDPDRRLPAGANLPPTSAA